MERRERKGIAGKKERRKERKRDLFLYYFHLVDLLISLGQEKGENGKRNATNQCGQSRNHEKPKRTTGNGKSLDAKHVPITSGVVGLGVGRVGVEQKRGVAAIINSGAVLTWQD